MQLEGSCVRLFLFSFGFRISFSELVFVCRYGDSFSGSLGIRYGHLLQRKKGASALKLLVFSAEEPSIIDLRPYGDAERENNMNETYITTELLAQYAHKLYEEEKSSATIEKYIRDVRTFSKYAGSQALTKDLTIAYISICVKSLDGLTILLSVSFLRITSLWKHLVLTPSCTAL